MSFVGIDPGKRGGVCILSPEGVHAVPMPVVGEQINGRELAFLLRNAGIVTIEHAQAMPKQGVTSMFKYGVGFGILIGVCEGLGLPYRLVKPRVWQQAVLGNGAGDTKARAVAFVHQRYPLVDLTPAQTRKPHDGIADAVCIAHWGKLNVLSA